MTQPGLASELVQCTFVNGRTVFHSILSYNSHMSISYYHVDAFTEELFAGNPAGVCILSVFPPDATMQKIAAENKHSETAFVAPRADGDFDLRWFTPEVEDDLCGHATLASVQRDQVSSEHQVVTDKDREPGTDLDGHGLVVRGPEAESSDAIRRILIRKLQNTEQGRAIAPQCKLLFTDGDLVLTQYLVQGIDELDVRYGLEGTCRIWRFHQSQLFPGDQISVDVGQKLTVLHEFLLIVVKRFLFGTKQREEESYDKAEAGPDL